jgi:hypothetical protein
LLHARGDVILAHVIWLPILIFDVYGQSIASGGIVFIVEEQ